MLILKKYKYYILAIVFIIILFLIFVFSSRKVTAPPVLEARLPARQAELPKTETQAPAKTEEVKAPEISFVGPRGNLPADTPE